MTDEDYETDDLLEAIEEANDLLVEGIEWANTTASRGSMRPSTAFAFDKLEAAHEMLSGVDPTRGTRGE